MSRRLLASAGITGAVLLVGVGLWRVLPEPSHAWLGTHLAEPEPAPALELTGQDGAPLRLADLRGRAVLVFFGYTHCPDVCPTTLYHLDRAYRALPEALRRRVEVLFVSVDPARDPPERLKAYVTHFHPDFRAATGSDAALAAMGRRWGVRWGRIPGGADGAYLIDHTSSVFLVGPEGRLQALYDQSDLEDSEALASDLAWVLEEKHP